MRLCPWALASRGSVLGLEIFCVLGLGLEPCVLDSTSAPIPMPILAIFNTISFSRFALISKMHLHLQNKPFL